MDDFNNNNDLVSIIVPIFNSEQFLFKCVNSLINQTYKRIEIVLIDDGSTDKSASICDKFREDYPNIFVYHKANGGTSEAKNIGIKNAKGEWILFVDSDDFIEDNYVELLIRNVIEFSLDISICGYQIDYIKDKFTIEAAVPFTKYFKSKTEVKAAISLLDARGLFNVSVCKLYKRKILIENNILFDVFLHTGEDLVLNCIYFKYINSLGLVNKTPYHYIRRNKESLVSSYKRDLINMVKKCNSSRKDLYLFYEMNSDQDIKIYGKTYIEYFAACIPNIYRINCDMKFDEKKKYIYEIVFDEELIKYINLGVDNLDYFTRLFVRICRIRNIYIMYFAYSFIFFLRNNFSGFYRIIRKFLFIRNQEIVKNI